MDVLTDGFQVGFWCECLLPSWSLQQQSRWSGGLCQIPALMLISSRHMTEDVLMSSVVHLMVTKYVSPCRSRGSCILTWLGSR